MFLCIKAYLLPQRSLSVLDQRLPQHSSPFHDDVLHFSRSSTLLLAGCSCPASDRLCSACMDIHVDTCIDTCIDPCVDPCIDSCIDPCIDSCVDPCIDPCVDPCIYPCVDPGHTRIHNVHPVVLPRLLDPIAPARHVRQDL